MEETYPLPPYETTTAEDYEERIRQIKPISYELLARYDNDEQHDIIDEECETGACLSDNIIHYSFQSIIRVADPYYAFHIE